MIHKGTRKRTPLPLPPPPKLSYCQRNPKYCKAAKLAAVTVGTAAVAAGGYYANQKYKTGKETAAENAEIEHHRNLNEKADSESKSNEILNQREQFKKLLQERKDANLKAEIEQQQSNSIQDKWKQTKAKVKSKEMEDQREELKKLVQERKDTEKEKQDQLVEIEQQQIKAKKASIERGKLLDIKKSEKIIKDKYKNNLNELNNLEKSSKSTSTGVYNYWNPSNVNANNEKITKLKERLTKYEKEYPFLKGLRNTQFGKRVKKLQSEFGYLRKCH